ncbi:MAG: alcohol dehydrogenase catalytic domain-containing protein [Lachnospiraceae bacterium]|nr:alcohol dehydrogenase catalytic domain-containing protein [Lachnospiraceae bacterium]
MLAAKLYGEKDVRIVECGVPQIGPDEILVRTSAAAICGSDLRMIENGYQGVDEAHPLILGHEMCGVIAETGKNVTEYSVGERVAVAPNIGCGHCRNCLEGDYHLCEEYQALGINMDGGFAQYIRIPQKALQQGNVIRIDENVSAQEAAVFEPAACVLNGQERIGIRPGEDVLIIGAGPIGVLHALLARLQGAGRIFLSDLAKERVKKCMELAPDIIPLDAENLEKAVMEKTKGAGVDVCITACAAKAVQETSFALMNMKGRILFFGGLPKGKDLIQMHSNLLHYKELKVCGSTRCNAQQCRKIASLVREGKLDLKGLISRKYELKDFEEAVRYAQSGQGLKTVILFEE